MRNEELEKWSPFRKLSEKLQKCITEHQLKNKWKQKENVLRPGLGTWPVLGRARPCPGLAHPPPKQAGPARPVSLTGCAWHGPLGQ